MTQRGSNKSPFDYRHPVSGDLFLGTVRKRQLNNIAADLSLSNGDSYMLIGGQRFGKSSFLCTLKEKLFQQLISTQQGERFPLPVLVNLGTRPFSSPEEVFAWQLHALNKSFSSAQQEVPGLLSAFDLINTLLASFKLSAALSCTREQFEDIVQEIAQRFTNICGTLSLIFLLDDVHKLLQYDWYTTFFDQLHYSKKTECLRYVLAGTPKLIKIQTANQYVFKELEVLENEAIHHMINQAGSLPVELIEAVQQQSGGHPFLAQYLLSGIWENLQDGTLPSIALLVDRFYTGPETAQIFLEWWNDLSPTSRFVYHSLHEASEALSRMDITKHLPTQEHREQVGLALSDLRYYGLIHRNEYAAYRPAGQLFRHWFGDGMLPLPSIERASLLHVDNESAFMKHKAAVRYSVFPDIYPIAYWHVLTNKTFPLITCEVDNTGSNCLTSMFTIKATITSLNGDPDVQTYTIPAGQKMSVQLLPGAKLTTGYTETYPARCYLEVLQKVNGLPWGIYETTIELQIPSMNTALLAIKKIGQKVQPFTDYLAVFITPHNPKVEQFLTVVEAEHKGIFYEIGQNPNYMNTSNDTQEIHKKFRTLVRGLFETLQKKAYLQYVPLFQNFGTKSDQLLQRVRLPWQCLPEHYQRYGQAYCLDGAILFASLLESIRLEPLLVFVPGHTFVGWYISRKAEMYDFLNLALLDQPFEKANDDGVKRYNQAIKNGDGTRDFLDKRGFLHIVDIKKCRDRNIRPLP